MRLRFNFFVSFKWYKFILVHRTLCKQIVIYRSFSFRIMGLFPYQFSWLATNWFWLRFMWQKRGSGWNVIMPANTFSHSTGIARLKELFVSLKAYFLVILALRKSTGRYEGRSRRSVKEFIYRWMTWQEQHSDVQCTYWLTGRQILSSAIECNWIQVGLAIPSWSRL